MREGCRSGVGFGRGSAGEKIDNSVIDAAVRRMPREYSVSLPEISASCGCGAIASALVVAITT